MAYTRDWIGATFADHSKFKTQPGYTRYLQTDIAERLKNFFYGFITGETEEGVKHLDLLVQATAPGSAADMVKFYAKDVGGKAEGHIKDEDGNVIPITTVGKLNTAILKDDVSATVCQSIIKAIYPVGSVYFSTLSTNPNTLLGFGTWAVFGAGRTLVSLDSGDGDFDASEKTGGAKTHTLTEAEIAAHFHTQTSYTNATDANAGPDGVGNSEGTTVNTGSKGGGGAHNNLQPYIVVYMWKRTA